MEPPGYEVDDPHYGVPDKVDTLVDDQRIYTRQFHDPFLKAITAPLLDWSPPLAEFDIVYDRGPLLFINPIIHHNHEDRDCYAPTTPWGHALKIGGILFCEISVPHESEAEQVLSQVRKFYQSSHFTLLEGRLLPAETAHEEPWNKYVEPNPEVPSSCDQDNSTNGGKMCLQMIWVKINHTCEIDTYRSPIMDNIVDLDDKNLYKRWTPEFQKEYEELRGLGEEGENPSILARMDIHRKSRVKLAEQNKRRAKRGFTDPNLAVDPSHPPSRSRTRERSGEVPPARPRRELGNSKQNQQKQNSPKQSSSSKNRERLFREQAAIQQQQLALEREELRQTQSGSRLRERKKRKGSSKRSHAQSRQEFRQSQNRTRSRKHEQDEDSLPP